MDPTYFERYVVSGGFMMWFLIPTSLLAVGWIVQGFVRLRKNRVLPVALIKAAKDLPDAATAASYQKMLAGHSSPLGRLAAHLLRLHVVGADEKSYEEEHDFLRPALSDEIDRLWQETTALATVYSVAPLMGLLGTVMGMMQTFYIFTTDPDHTIEKLSLGINEALVTTMWGLFIAIPAYIFVQIFRHRIFLYEKDLLPRLTRDLAHAVWERKRDNSREDNDKA